MSTFLKFLPRRVDIGGMGGVKRTQSSVLPSPPADSEHEHLVEFYETDEHLIDVISGFIGPALREGDAAIVVATSTHRSALGAALGASGVDVGAAAAVDRYLTFDAAELLATFMVGGAPDAKLFRDTVGGVIARASADGRRVRIYGEMVAVLWDEGNVASAIALEDLWNDLAATYQFALLCAYPMRSFDDEASGAAFTRIRNQHSAVVSGGGSAEVSRRQPGPGPAFVAPAFYEQLVEAAPDATVVVNATGEIVLVNRQAELMFGWARADLLGRPVEVLLAPALKEHHRGLRASYVADPKTRPMAAGQTLTAVRADGTEVLVDISLSPIETPTGTVVKAAIRDATQRIQVERALQAGEARLRTSLEKMLDGFAIVRSVREAGRIVDFEWVYINSVGAARYDRTAEELMGSRMKALLPMLASSGRFVELCRVVETGEPLDRVGSAQEDEGASGIFACRAWKLDDGFASTWRDVTDSEETAATLRATQERFRASVENLHDALSVFSAVRDEQGTIVDFRCDYANTQASVVAGHEPADLEGRRLLEVLPEHDPGGMFNAYRRVVETGEPWVEPSLWNDEASGDGHPKRRCFNVRATKLQDGFVVVTREVTDQREQEEELARQRAALEASNADLEARSKAMTRLAKGTEALQRCSSREEALQIIARATALVFSGTAGALYAETFAGQGFASAATWDGFQGAETLKADDCWALRTRAIHMFGDDPLALRCRHVSAQSEATACIPLVSQGETVAFIHLDNEGGGADCTQQRELAELLSTQWGLTLANLRLRESLREQSVRDPLTGLFNRRYLDESLEQAVHRAERHSTPLCVVMLDLDHFKSFNDTHGHPSGDTLLRDFGRFLLESTRREDVVGRFGGEEFVIVMPYMSDSDGLSRLDAMLHRWRQHESQSSQRDLHPYPTFSAGVGSFSGNGQTGGDLLAVADRALYRAKSEGRDRVVMGTAS